MCPPASQRGASAWVEHCKHGENSHYENRASSCHAALIQEKCFLAPVPICRQRIPHVRDWYFPTVISHSGELPFGSDSPSQCIHKFGVKIDLQQRYYVAFWPANAADIVHTCLADDHPDIIQSALSFYKWSNISSTHFNLTAAWIKSVMTMSHCQLITLKADC